MYVHICMCLYAYICMVYLLTPSLPSLYPLPLAAHFKPLLLLLLLANLTA